jgi:hypothetical protein
MSPRVLVLVLVLAVLLPLAGCASKSGGDASGGNAATGNGPGTNATGALLATAPIKGMINAGGSASTPAVGVATNDPQASSSGTVDVPAGARSAEFVLKWTAASPAGANLVLHVGDPAKQDEFGNPVDIKQAEGPSPLKMTIDAAGLNGHPKLAWSVYVGGSPAGATAGQSFEGNATFYG